MTNDTIRTQQTDGTKGKKHNDTFDDEETMDLRNMQGGSNIHQLYQDLFITDMKEEIAVASNEVLQLR